MSDSPDEYTNLWWRTQTRGILHSMNRCNAEYSSAQDQIEALQSRCEALERAQMEMASKIGELQESLEKAREAFSALKKANGH